MRYFKCFTTRAARYLVNCGFKIVKTEINYNDPRYNVFLFEDCQLLREAFDKYQTLLQQNK